MTVKIWYKVEELEEASINFEQNKTVNNLKRAIIKNEPILNGLSSSKITLKITKEGDNKIYIVSPRWVIQKVLQEIGNNFLCLIHKKELVFDRKRKVTEEVQDVSTRVLDTLKKIPRMTLPAVNELTNFLEQPLSIYMKIPILQHEFNSLVINEPENPCTQEDLEILFQVNDIESSYYITTKLFSVAILGNPPSHEGTEYSFVSFWDINIRFPLEHLIPDGYYANGPDVTFVAICRPLPTNDSPEVAIIVNSNLNMRRNQIFNLRRMINLSILIKSLQDVIGWHETPEFRPIVRERQTIEEFDRRVEKLKNVYNILTKKKVPNVDLLLHANNGSDEVYLGLKGMSVRPNNQKELLEAVVCVLEALVVLHGGNEPIFHQDIQWPNIIKLPGELLKWILIDWDDTDRPLTRPANHLGRDNHTPEVFEEDHGGEVDIWSIGRLIIEVNKWIMGLSQSIVDIGVTIQSNNRPNAHDALEFVRFLTQ
ncbi:20336_t:CDS:2 [Funneliformis geosporum]|nr:20336_t:CDS:2 [Funneliformis geosporum]